MIKDLTIERDQDLRKLANDMGDGVINSRYYTDDDLANLIMTFPAPKFYITPKKAEQYVLHYYRGIYLLKGHLGRKKIQDLVETYEHIKSQYPNKKQYQIWQMVAESNAKSFYLSRKSIKFIIKEYIKRK